MQLGLTVVLVVLAVTAVAGAAGYLIDLSVRNFDRRRRHQGGSGQIRKQRGTLNKTCWIFLPGSNKRG
jgi:hypothetical protein